MAELEQILERAAHVIRFLNGQPDAPKITETLYDLYRQRPGHEPVHFSYDLPDADYRAALGSIEERLKEEAKLEGHFFDYPNANYLTLVYNVLDKIDNGVGIGVSILGDAKGAYKLLFNFWGQNLTKKFVEDNYRGLVDTVHKIVAEEGQKSTVN